MDFTIFQNGRQRVSEPLLGSKTIPVRGRMLIFTHTMKALGVALLSQVSFL